MAESDVGGRCESICVRTSKHCYLLAMLVLINALKVFSPFGKSSIDLPYLLEPADGTI